MSEMIPEDIDIIASGLVRVDYSKKAEPAYAMYLAIAKAILAERERCIALIKDMAEYEGYDFGLIDKITNPAAVPPPAS